MKNPYFYLFYKLYVLFRKLNMKYGPSEMVAMGGVSLLVLANSLTLSEFWNISFHTDTAVIFSLFFILGVNYWLFVYKDKYDKIENMFINESKLSSFIGGTLVLGYIVFSIYAFFKYAVP